MTRTTMIVKLHPGQAKRLSAYLEGQQVSFKMKNLNYCDTKSNN